MIPKRTDGKHGSAPSTPAFASSNRSFSLSSSAKIGLHRRNAIKRYDDAPDAPDTHPSRTCVRDNCASVLVMGGCAPHSWKTVPGSEGRKARISGCTVFVLVVMTSAVVAVARTILSPIAVGSSSAAGFSRREVPLSVLPSAKVNVFPVTPPSLDLSGLDLSRPPPLPYDPASLPPDLGRAVGPGSNLGHALRPVLFADPGKPSTKYKPEHLPGYKMAWDTRIRGDMPVFWDVAFSGSSVVLDVMRSCHRLRTTGRRGNYDTRDGETVSFRCCIRYLCIS